MAVAILLAAAVTLFWPMLGGAFLAGPHSDQYIAGFGFRYFGAQAFRDTGAIPLWNPYILGGLPFAGAMHGDVYYPTAWLRWILPTGMAMNLGFFFGVLLAGWFCYRFLLSLGLRFEAALLGGIAYELTGMTASLVQPGHDGKLFVTALTPLLFLGLVRGLRDRKSFGFGVVALVVGLAFLGHPQAGYYAMVAGGIWSLYLVFLDPDRPVRTAAQRVLAVGFALGAVLIGIGIYAIQLLPALDYLPYSPRGSGGPSGGWEYAVGFSLPPEEIVSTFLPQFNGIIEAYWGRNGIKFHTEHLGVTVLLLAMVGWGARERRSLRNLLVGLGGLFLLISLGGHTPFYRLWYEVMPMMKSVRAPGMAFFMVSFVVVTLAAIGVDRIFQHPKASRIVLGAAIPFMVIGLVGALGGLQPIAETLAPGQFLPLAVANASAVALGSLRVLAFAGVMAGVAWVIMRRDRLSLPAITIVGLAVFGDLWSIDRRFFTFSPPTAVTYADDLLTSTMRETPLPWRAWDPAGGYAQFGVYRGKSFLMAYEIPTLLGYHGNEIRYFDDLLGGKNIWADQLSPNILDLYGVRYILLSEPNEIPGYHLVLGPSPTVTGGQGLLYEADEPPPWVRVVPAAATLPEEQIQPTVVDPRFPLDRVVLYPDTVAGVPVRPVPSDPSPIAARLEEWGPGRMRISLAGSSDSTSYLLVAENWYPDWRARVDGVPVPIRRANLALLSVELPAGAKEVVLEFALSDRARLGRRSAVLSVAVAMALLAWPGRRRRSPGGDDV